MPTDESIEIRPASTSANFENASAKVSKVLMISNLPNVQENYTGMIMRLFNLFCHYGNVSAIKISYRNRNCAAIEFQNTHQATFTM